MYDVNQYISYTLWGGGGGNNTDSLFYNVTMCFLEVSLPSCSTLTGPAREQSFIEIIKRALHLLNNRYKDEISLRLYRAFVL